MSDVVKEAIIRLRVEQIQATLTAPNLSPIVNATKEYNEQLDKISRATEASTAHAKAMQDAIVALTAAINAHSAALEQAGKSTRESTDNSNSAIDDRLDKLHEMLDEIHRIIEAERRYAQVVVDSSSKILTAMTRGSSGVFMMARGFTLLGVSAEEDMRKVMESIALVQGAFDIFKGGAQVIKSLIEANKALTAIKQAAIAVEVAHGAAIQGTTAAQAASLAVTGPLGLAFLAVGAVVAAGIVSWRNHTEEQERAAEAIRKLDEEYAKFAQNQADRQNAILSIQTRRIALIQDEHRQIEALTKVAQPAFFMGLKANTWSGNIGGGVIGPQGSKAEGEALLGVLDAQLRIYEQIEAAESRRLSSRMESLDAEKTSIENAMRELELANRNLAAEDQRVMSMRARIGLLNQEEQEELKYLAGRAKASGLEGLSQPELQRLLQLGGGRVQGAVEGEAARRGAGIDRDLERQFGGDRQDELREDIRRREDVLKDIVGHFRTVEEALAQNAQARKEYEREAAWAIETARSTMSGLLQVMLQVKSRLLELEAAQL